MTTDTEPRKPGCLGPILWTVAALVVTVVAGAFIGVMAADSESAGVTATYAAALPVGAAWSAALGSVIAWFARPKSGMARAGLPLGCGCLGGLAFLAAIVVFFTAIFPAL